MAKLTSRVAEASGRFVKGSVGVLLVPPTIGLARGLFNQLETVPAGSAPAGLWFAWGLGSYALMHILLVKPLPLFSLNHVLLARLAGWLFGGQVSTVGAEATASVKPAKRGRGRRKTSTSDEGDAEEASTLVVLSPYLLPIYVVLFCVAVGAVGRQVTAAWWPAAVSTTVGVGLGFHLAMTGEDLQQHAEQFPIETRLMALTISAMSSILITSLVLPMALPSLSVSGIFSEMAASTSALYDAIFRTLFSPTP
jgi:hypothetical protein